ncbi:hypothetical protein Dip510_000309 [Elusimicrobium posterum]
MAKFIGILILCVVVIFYSHSKYEGYKKINKNNRRKNRPVF